jgi:hypothetical protein
VSDGVGPAYEAVRAGDIVHLYEHWLHTAEIKGLGDAKADALWHVVAIVHAALSGRNPSETDLEWRRAISRQTGRFIRRALAEAAERQRLKNGGS